MQVAVDANRVIHQHGSGLGPLENPPCTVEEVGDDTYAGILAALEGAEWGVTLSEDHSAVTPAPEPPEAAAARQAHEAAMARRDADLALLAASDDPAHQAMARLLAGG